MRRSWIAAALLVAASLLAGAAQALPADKHLTLEADDGDSCTSEQKVDCFRVVNGSLDGFVQGMRVHVALENVGGNPHNVFVTTGEQSDDNHVDTPAEAAINSSETVDPDQSANLTFTVPEDATGLYFWCDVQSHEALGMWLNASVATPVEARNGTNDTSQPSGANDSEEGAGGDGNPIPAPSLGVVGLAGALAAAARRRGSD